MNPEIIHAQTRHYPQNDDGWLQNDGRPWSATPPDHGMTLGDPTRPHSALLLQTVKDDHLVHTQTNNPLPENKANWKVFSGGRHLTDTPNDSWTRIKLNNPVGLDLKIPPHLGINYKPPTHSHGNLHDAPSINIGSPRHEVIRRASAPDGSIQLATNQDVKHIESHDGKVQKLIIGKPEPHCMMTVGLTHACSNGVGKTMLAMSDKHHISVQPGRNGDDPRIHIVSDDDLLRGRQQAEARKQAASKDHQASGSGSGPHGKAHASPPDMRTAFEHGERFTIHEGQSGTPSVGPSTPSKSQRKREARRAAKQSASAPASAHGTASRAPSPTASHGHARAPSPPPRPRTLAHSPSYDELLGSSSSSSSSAGSSTGLGDEQRGRRAKRGSRADAGGTALTRSTLSASDLAHHQPLPKTSPPSTGARSFSPSSSSPSPVRSTRQIRPDSPVRSASPPKSPKSDIAGPSSSHHSPTARTSFTSPARPRRAPSNASMESSGSGPMTPHPSPVSGTARSGSAGSTSPRTPPAASTKQDKGKGPKSAGSAGKTSDRPPRQTKSSGSGGSSGGTPPAPTAADKGPGRRARRAAAKQEVGFAPSGGAQGGQSRDVSEAAAHEELLRANTNRSPSPPPKMEKVPKKGGGGAGRPYGQKTGGSRKYKPDG